ncbi:MAG TPA: energy transducer TonB [Rhodocyclaceae bacterium]|nr:energy transducer TonB [Rhodocyclaceae bacterium]
MTLVIGFHVIVGYFIAQGLTHKMSGAGPEAFDVNILEEAKKPPPDKPPPPPPKTAPLPPPVIPPVEVPIPVSTQSASGPTITVSHDTKPVEAPPPVVRVPPVVSAGSCSKPEYPAASKRLEEQGTVTLAFLIDVDGSILQSKVENSSGYERLDQAALEGLKRCKFKPGTVDGKPEQSWHRMKYTWKLQGL